MRSGARGPHKKSRLDAHGDTVRMSAQKAISGVRRLGKEAYQFRFTSEFKYITLECKGTW